MPGEEDDRDDAVATAYLETCWHLARAKETSALSAQSSAVADETVFDRLGERPPMAERIGWTLLGIDKDTRAVRLSFTTISDFTNPVGYVHGGFVVAMLDECMGSAVVGITDAAAFPVTVSLSTDFIRPVHVGKVFAEGRITSMSGKSAFLEATLTDADGELLARAIGAYRLLPFIPPTQNN